ncbi:MAG TPA: hypothetical protein PLF30_04270 [Candidatus Moranbacteria bacterium]|jgi:predicted DNA-binding transcriptional regulator YafY|nr:hypothetical protein [Candidatus Moranbacteria bacterium]HQB59920.1 hypothetical protein [Candidatus Moranbacteria bacterium]
MKNIICDAIKSRKLLEFYYNEYYRVVEPFTLGVSHKNNDVLAAYQVDGDSDSNNSDPWRLFNLEDIENLQVLNESFGGNRDGYRKGDSRMSIIHCEI